MTELLEIVSRLEEAGGKLTLDGERIRYSIPSGDTETLSMLAELRKRKSDVAAFLRTRDAIPAMPPGVRLVKWNVKEPPIAVEYHAVVTDPAKFACATLGELSERLANPKRKYGWSAPQLIDRLAQVGVTVVLESTGVHTEPRP